MSTKGNLANVILHDKVEGEKITSKANKTVGVRCKRMDRAELD